MYEAFTEYWPYVLGLTVLFLGVVGYLVFNGTLKLKLKEGFKSPALPNTPEDEVTQQDKECAFMHMAIETSKQFLKEYEDPNNKAKIVEGFKTQEDEKEFDEEKKQHTDLIKSYTARMKEIGCQYYEAMVAEAMSNPAPKE